MNSCVFYGKGDLRISELEIPKLKSGEVLVKVKASGICGTDVHIYDGSEGSAKVNAPQVLGHEFAGEVCGIGNKVTHLKIGDRVSIDPNISCGCCKYCRKGLVHLCEDLSAIGVTQDGGFAEYCAVPEKQALKIGETMSFIEGAFVEPVACCLHGINLAGIKIGDTVLIVGGGTIGLIMMQLAKNAGASKVIISEPIEAKRTKALEMGASAVYNPLDKNSKEMFLDITEGGANVSIECVGRKDTVIQAIENTAKGGTVLIFGVSDPKVEVPIKPFEMFQRELTIKASFINPFTHANAIEMLSSKRLEVESLVAAKTTIDKMPEVFSTRKLIQQGKVMIEF